MPKEVRRLIFSHAESFQAMSSYGERLDMVFPTGRIIRANFAGLAEFEMHTQKEAMQEIAKKQNIARMESAVIVTFFDESTFEHRQFNLTADFISAALVEYCIEHKIMMPRQAKKILDLTEFNICLDVIFESETIEDSENLSFDDQ